MIPIFQLVPARITVYDKMTTEWISPFNIPRFIITDLISTPLSLVPKFLTSPSQTSATKETFCARAESSNMPHLPVATPKHPRAPPWLYDVRMPHSTPNVAYVRWHQPSVISITNQEISSGQHHCIRSIRRVALVITATQRAGVDQLSGQLMSNKLTYKLMQLLVQII